MIPQLWEFLQPIEGVGYVTPGEEAISLTQFRRMFGKISTEINLYGATSHIFRHTYASFVANKAKVAKTVVKSVLGHADERTTERYVHTDDDDLKEARESITEVFTPPSEA